MKATRTCARGTRSIWVRSYRDGGEREKAIAAFLARADQGFWNQEVYLSLYYAAQMQAALDYPFETVFATYQRATQVVPNRAGGAAPRRVPDCAGSRAATPEGLRGRQAVGLPLTPPNDALFVETWIYDFGLLDEFSINAYWAGHYQESLDASLRLLGENKFPAHERSRIFGNARFSIDKLKPAAPAAARPAEARCVDIPACWKHSLRHCFGRHRQAPPRPARRPPPVSIITPTGGRGAFLTQALEYFRKPRLPKSRMADSSTTVRSRTRSSSPELHAPNIPLQSLHWHVPA